MPIGSDELDEPRILPAEDTQRYTAALFEAVNQYRFSTESEPRVIQMAAAARHLILEDWNRFCAMAKGGEDSPFEARHTENAIRLALVLHAFRSVRFEPSSGKLYATMYGHERDLEEEDVQCGLTIRNWFTRHQTEFRAPKRLADDDLAWKKTQELIRDRPPNFGITRRDLYTGHRVCRDRMAAGRLLEQWCKEGRIVPFDRKPEGAGRPTIAYRFTTNGARNL